jgi:hypothetical protein
MSNFRSVLCLLAILVAYGIAGRMDYDDAVMLEQARQAEVMAADVAGSAMTAVGDETPPGVPAIGARRIGRDADASFTASACRALWPSKSR